MFPTLPALLPRALAAAALLTGASLLHAQALPPGVHLGMTSDALKTALPGVERVDRPQRLAGGLIGSWHAPPELIAGLRFEPVFFFSGGQLRRIEWVAATPTEPDLAATAFDELVAWGRSAFGAELASSDPGSAYAAWVQGDTDIYVQHVSDPRRASVRLVYKARRVKDASEL